MKVKKFLRWILAILLIILIVAALYAAKKNWFFTAAVTKDILIKQTAFKNSYSLVDASSDNVIVEEVQGWYFEKKYIVGSFGEASYYIYDRVCKKTMSFQTIDALIIALEKFGIAGYAYSEEEGPANLIYEGNGSIFSTHSEAISSYETLACQ